MPLKQYLKELERVTKKEWIKIKEKYSKEEIINALIEIENESKKNIDLSIKDALENAQKELWNKYGYCYSVLHYYPYEEEIFKNMKPNKELTEEEKEELKRRIRLGFQLLAKNYIVEKDSIVISIRIKNDKGKLEDILDYNKLDYNKLLKLEDKKKKYIIEKILEFYKKYQAESNHDKKMIIDLKEELKKLQEVESEAPDETLEEQLQLFFAYKEAFFVYTHENTGLISIVISNYEEINGIEKDDYFYEGYFGLCQAAQKYDIRKGNSFGAYACHYIRHSCQSLLENRGSIKVPMWFIRECERIKKINNEFLLKYKRTATVKEIAEITGMSETTIKDIIIRARIVNCDSLQRVIKKDEHGNVEEVEKFLEDSKQQFEDRIIYNVLLEEIIEIMGTILTEKEKQIIFMRLGIGYDREYTQEEIGKLFSCTRQNIQILEKNALKRTRENARIKKKNPFN